MKEVEKIYGDLLMINAHAKLLSVPVKDSKTTYFEPIDGDIIFLLKDKIDRIDYSVDISYRVMNIYCVAVDLSHITVYLMKKHG